MVTAITRRSSAPTPPGPRGHFYVGHLPDYRRDPLGFFARCARDYGDVVALRFFHVPYYLVSHPSLIEEVLVTHHRDFIKSMDYRMWLRAVLGDGLLTSEGDVWRRQRRLSQPAFHQDRMAAYARVIAALAERMLGRWTGGETRDIHAEIMRLTLQIVTKVLFGADVDREARDVDHALDVVMRHAAEWSALPIPLFVPTPGNLRWKRAIRRLDEIVYGIIRGRRESGVDTGDLLSLLLGARDEDGNRMTNRQIRDEVMTVVLAGHETTALALSWTLYLLAQHPAVEAKLWAEIDAVVGDRPPAMADLPGLQYTEQVLKEAMRLYPPVWGIGREARQDGSIAGFRLRRKTQVFISQYVVHRDPRWYDTPARFWPERWATGLEQRLPRFAYFPFGGGPRHCIGHAFAMTEAMLLLAAVARRFRARPVPDRPPVAYPTITLRPKDGLWMTLARR